MLSVPKQLEELVKKFLNLLRGPLDFDDFLVELKQDYWLTNKEWLADAIPWREIKRYGLKQNSIHMLTESKALLVVYFEIDPTIITTFSLLKVDDKWFVDWQNRDVWLLASENWESRKDDKLEIRFFETFSKGETDFIFNRLNYINKWIYDELDVTQEKLVIVFGYDSYEYYISNTGHKPSSGGGNSRGKLIMMGEKFPDLRAKNVESTYFESILLHEMIHEYTSYDKKWNGSISSPSLKLSLINEGVAFYYQMKFFMEEYKNLCVDKDDLTIESIKKGVEYAYDYKGSILELLFNEKFNDVNNQTSGNPAYLLGASLYGFILNKLGGDSSKELYSQIGSMPSDRAKSQLTAYLDDGYINYAKNYIANILDEFQRQ